MLPTVISSEIEAGIKSFLRKMFLLSPSTLESTLSHPYAELNEVRALQSGMVNCTITVERWHAPFTRCDRETDYATVWRKLEECS